MHFETDFDVIVPLCRSDSEDVTTEKVSQNKSTAGKCALINIFIDLWVAGLFILCHFYFSVDGKSMDFSDKRQEFVNMMVIMSFFWGIKGKINMKKKKRNVLFNQRKNIFT